MSGKQDNRRPSEKAPQRIRELMGLFAQRDSISEAIKDICAAEKDDGGNAKAMRQAATRLHKANEHERAQAEQEITEYEAAYTNFGTPVATRAQAGVRGKHDSAPDASATSERASAGGDGGTNGAAGQPNTPASEASAPAEVSGNALHERLPPQTAAAADKTGDPQPAAADFSGTQQNSAGGPDTAGVEAGDGSPRPSPSPAAPTLADTFTSQDTMTRAGYLAHGKGMGRDDHGMKSEGHVSKWQAGWDLAARQAHRGQG